MFIFYICCCQGTLVGLPTAELVDVSADDEQAWVSYDRQEGAVWGLPPLYASSKNSETAVQLTIKARNIFPPDVYIAFFTENE